MSRFNTAFYYPILEGGAFDIWDANPSDMKFNVPTATTIVVDSSLEANLPHIAYEYLGDTSLWWTLLYYNGITDPISDIYSLALLRIPDRQALISYLERTIPGLSNRSYSESKISAEHMSSPWPFYKSSPCVPTAVVVPPRPLILQFSRYPYGGEDVGYDPGRAAYVVVGAKTDEDVVIDWGDGTTTIATTTGTYAHEYPSEEDSPQSLWECLVSGGLVQLGYEFDTESGSAQEEEAAEFATFGITETEFGPNDPPPYNDRLTAVIDFGTIPTFTHAMFHRSSINSVPTELSPFFRSMKQMFNDCYYFNSPSVLEWDTSYIVNMQETFASSVIDQPIGGWNVSNVTTMRRMFQNCPQFNHPLGTWNLVNLLDASYMFLGCTTFDQPLQTWNVSSVTNMEGMFSQCRVFNRSLHTWDVSSVTSMKQMFFGCEGFNQPLDTWDVSSVTTMNLMFGGCYTFNQPLNSWNVSSVIDMNHMFEACQSFNGQISDWDVSSVKLMFGTFSECFSFNQFLGTWDVSSVETMSQMFQYAAVFDQDISQWNVSNCHYMAYMFYGAESFNQPLGGWPANWDVSSVGAPSDPANYPESYNEYPPMEAMFYGASSFNQDLSSWCVPNIPVQPWGFNVGAGVIQSPQWGTCPTEPPPLTAEQ